MHLDHLRATCLALPGTQEELPFGPQTLVFKVGGKIYALAAIEPFDHLTVKCDPERAVALRDRYGAVQPGYHMNKRHWNTLWLGQDLPDREVLHWVNHAYKRVVAALPAAVRARLATDA